MPNTQFYEPCLSAQEQWVGTGLGRGLCGDVSPQGDLDPKSGPVTEETVGFPPWRGNGAGSISHSNC
jgi:hypothetical protein